MDVENRSAVLSSLQTALNANRRLQERLKERLQEILQKKQRNRQAAAKEFGNLGRSSEEDDEADDVSSPCSATPQQVMDFYQAATKNTTESSSPSSLSRVKARAFQFQPDRKWNFSYFVDPSESRPALNPDTLQRQALQQHLQPDIGPPTGKKKTKAKRWSKDEGRYLLERIQEIMNRDDHGVVDWSRMALDLQEHVPRPASSQKTAWDCACYYAQHKVALAKTTTTTITTTTTTAIQSPSLRAASSKANTATTSTTSQIMTLEQDERLFRYLALQGPQYVWDYVAAGIVAASRLLQLLRNHNHHHHHDDPYSEDAVQPVAVQPLWIRSNATSSINPQIASDPYWNKESERKLVLLMKVYYTRPNQNNDSSTQDENGDDENGEEQDTSSSPPSKKNHPTTKKQKRRNTPAAISNATAHFPHRTRDQIFHKWQRSSDPALDHERWTEEEDQRLKTIVQQALQHAHQTGQPPPAGLAEMARPALGHRRKSHQIYQRWLEIGTPEEIVAWDAWQFLLQQQQQQQQQVPQNASTTLLTSPTDDDAAATIPAKPLAPDQFRLEWNES